jgi:hypothetical protein
MPAPVGQPSREPLRARARAELRYSLLKAGILEGIDRPTLARLELE